MFWDVDMLYISLIVGFFVVVVCFVVFWGFFKHDRIALVLAQRSNKRVITPASCSKTSHVQSIFPFSLLKLLEQGSLCICNAIHISHYRVD